MAVKDLVRKTKGSEIQEQGNNRNDLATRGGRDFPVSPFGAFDPVPQFRREMDRLFDTFFGNFGLESRMPSLWSGVEEWQQRFSPSIDIRDNGKEVCIVAELPGIDEKDLDVELTGNHLTVRGEKREENDEKDKEGWHRVERRFGSFERIVPLPEGIDVDKVKAEFKRGVLSVTLPRRPEAQVERRKITVQGGNGAGVAEKKAA